MNVQRGYVLLMVMLVILIITSLSALAIRQSLTDGRLAFVTGKMNALFVMADRPLAQLNHPSVRQSIVANDGILPKLVQHHQRLIYQDVAVDEGVKTQQTIGVMCYDLAQGFANFHQSKLKLPPLGVRCAEDQVWLWWVLDEPFYSHDLSYMPSGVSVDDVLGDDMVQEVAPLHLTVYALAVVGMNKEPCDFHPLQIKACLEDDGISHQMLAQEYEYVH